MNPALQGEGFGITRRGFLLGAGTGLAAGIPLTWLALRAGSTPGAVQAPTPSPGFRPEQHQTASLGMPGPFPGRVIEVNHADSVRTDHSINADAVKQMIDRGMRELTGADHASEAWEHFFKPGDVVGIKVNPVGQGRPGVVGAISNPAVVLEVVAGLKNAGVKAKDIIVFERYASEFRSAGYEQLMWERAMDGVRWYASSVTGGNLQVDIEGHDGQRERDPHVVGYDPDVFVHMGFSHPDHDPKDDRRFRSHLSVIVTRMVDKFITIPVLKDHRSAGMTMALKNMSHGFNNNVARSHIAGIYRLDRSPSGPNQCNTFIPAAAGQMLMRQKATLHIGDGLIGVYEGGPGAWNATWGTWPYKALFFATDPVAMDHVGWNIIDAKRAQEGWQPVAKMGLLSDMPAEQLSRRLAALPAQKLSDKQALEAARRLINSGRSSEVFDRRQPEHIILSSLIGLGRFNANEIDHRVFTLPA
jgi:uncharacterized protein (DUF362 family)